MAPRKTPEQTTDPAESEQADKPADDQQAPDASAPDGTEQADKPAKVEMVFDATGRRMEASKASFNSYYSKNGWSLVDPGDE